MKKKTMKSSKQALVLLLLMMLFAMLMTVIQHIRTSLGLTQIFVAFGTSAALHTVAMRKISTDNWCTAAICLK